MIANLISETQLKKEGYRITDARSNIIKIFNSSQKPLSAREIMKALVRRQITVNKTTVYRELAFLLKQDLIQEVFTNKKKICYESKLLAHHHHLICKDCGVVKDVYLEQALGDTEKKLAQENDFKIESHSLEFFGLCALCR